MISNKDMPAIPTEPIDTSLSFDDETGGGRFITSLGLTKREMFAMHAMQALATNTGYGTWQDMANDAVNIADTLLAELEKQK